MAGREFIRQEVLCRGFTRHRHVDIDASTSCFVGFFDRDFMKCAIGATSAIACGKRRPAGVTSLGGHEMAHVGSAELPVAIKYDLLDIIRIIFRITVACVRATWPETWILFPSIGT